MAVMNRGIFVKSTTGATRRCQKVRRQKCQNFEFEKVLNYVFSLIAVVSHMCQGPGTEKNGA